MPDNMSNLGLLIAPADIMTSLFAKALFLSPCRMYSTPKASFVFSLKSIFVAKKEIHLIFHLIHVVYVQGDNLRMHALVTVYHVNKQL